jgi:hypothetical protein
MKLKSPWSYSSLSAFLKCPRQFDLVRNKKVVKDQGNEATVWGSRVHDALEHRIKDRTPMPAGLERFESVAQELESWSDDWITEEKFGLTENLEPTDFFARDVWCRGVLDVYTVRGNRAFVADYKTGKMRPDMSQLKLFAAAIFHKYQHVDKIKTAFIWLNHDSKTVEDFTREDLSFIWKYFLPQLRRLEIAYEKDVWPPNPSPLCAWCPVGLTHCEHWRERK